MDSHCVYTDSGGHGPNDLDASHELHACACPGCLGVFVVVMSMVSFIREWLEQKITTDSTMQYNWYNFLFFGGKVNDRPLHMWVVD